MAEGSESQWIPKTAGVPTSQEMKRRDPGTREGASFLLLLGVHYAACCDFNPRGSGRCLPSLRGGAWPLGAEGLQLPSTRSSLQQHFGSKGFSCPAGALVAAYSSRV